MLARWIEELSQYDMIIQHRPGSSMVMLMACPEFLMTTVTVMRLALMFPLSHVEDVNFALRFITNGHDFLRKLMMSSL